jgi:signal transduction histidine kinase
MVAGRLAAVLSSGWANTVTHAIFEPPPWPRALLALRTMCAVDEVASTMRHQALNELTGVGALIHRIRSRAGAPSGRPGPGELGPLFEAVETRLQGASARLGFRFLPPPVPAAPTQLGARSSALLDAFGVKSELQGDPSATAVIAPDEFDVALGCLLENAIEALAQGGRPGRLELRLERRADCWAFEVSDDGLGLGLDVFEHLHDPFFTTHPGRAGLGLKIARRIVNRWAGELQLTRHDPRGLSAVLLLPAA